MTSHMETSSMPNPLATESIDTRIAAAVQAVRQPRPTQVRPIVVIGAGGIVRAAHLPAYEKAGFPVIGLMDQDGDKAAALAAERRISHSFGSVTEAVRFAPPDAVLMWPFPLLSSSTSFPSYPIRRPCSFRSLWGRRCKKLVSFAIFAGARLSSPP